MRLREAVALGIAIGIALGVIVVIGFFYDTTRPVHARSGVIIPSQK